MILYKYWPPARTDSLKGTRFMFTRPKAFNDPFELRPGFEDAYDPASADRIEGIEWFGRLLKAAARRDEERQWELAVKSVVILSMSSRWDSLLMWAHYAQSHEGFVVGVNTEHPSIRQGQFRHLGEVQYVEARPVRKLYEQIINDELLLTKSVEWQYEKEWRFLDSTFEADGEPPAEAPHCWPFRFDPQAVREVIMGCRATTALASELEQILATPGYRHVALARTVVHETRYQLEKRPIGEGGPLAEEWTDELATEEDVRADLWNLKT